MAVTFKDIAEKAGVSYSTVSRVINDHASVSPEAAAAVRRVMKELGYRPPPPERRRGPMRGAPRREQTGALALLFPDTDARAIRTPLSAALTHGVESFLYERRMSLMVTHLRDGDRLPVCLEKRQVDGVIIRGGELKPAMVNRLRSHPVVWIFQPASPIDWADQVQPDNEAIGRLALEYLRKEGVARVVAWNPRPTHASFSRRVRAFEQAAAETGIACVVSHAPLDEPLEQLSVALESRLRPEGIFCPGDEASVAAACGVLREGGLKPGKDVQVIACANDVQRLRAICPGLPNIDIQPEAVGRTAAERLLWRLDNPREPIQRLLIAPRLDVP